MLVLYEEGYDVHVTFLKKEKVKEILPSKDIIYPDEIRVFAITNMVRSLTIMSSEKFNPRILGVAFFIVAIASLVSEVLFSALVESGDMSTDLTNIANNVLQLRMSIIVDMITAVGIIVLGVLLYTVLSNQNKIVANIAISFYLAESIILAVSKTNLFYLISVSQEWVLAGSPSSSYFQTLGILFLGIIRAGYNIHMVFFALGGILFYYLLYRSEVVPKALTIFALIAISLVLVGALLAIFELYFIIFMLPNMLFELSIGIWIMAKGLSETS